MTTKQKPDALPTPDDAAEKDADIVAICDELDKHCPGVDNPVWDAIDRIEARLQSAAAQTVDVEALTDALWKATQLIERSMMINPKGWDKPEVEKHIMEWDAIRTRTATGHLKAQAVPAGWRFSEDGTGFVQIDAPGARSIRLGYMPQGSEYASNILRDLGIAMLAASPTVQPDVGALVEALQKKVQDLRPPQEYTHGYTSGYMSGKNDALDVFKELFSKCEGDK